MPAPEHSAETLDYASSRTPTLAKTPKRGRGACLGIWSCAFLAAEVAAFGLCCWQASRTQGLGGIGPAVLGVLLLMFGGPILLTIGAWLGIKGILRPLPTPWPYVGFILNGTGIAALVVLWSSL